VSPAPETDVFAPLEQALRERKALVEQALRTWVVSGESREVREAVHASLFAPS
jgi:hypothetical protein